MLYATDDGRRRLFRQGDEADPRRAGKIVPESQDIPAEYRYLLDWYANEYDAAHLGGLSGEEEQLLSEIRQEAKAKALNVRVEYRVAVQGPQLVFIPLKTTDEGDGCVEYLPDNRAERALRIHILHEVLTYLRAC